MNKIRKRKQDQKEKLIKREITAIVQRQAGMTRAEEYETGQKYSLGCCVLKQTKIQLKNQSTWKQIFQNYAVKKTERKRK